MESDLAIDGQSQFIAVEVASAHYADVFGVRPSLGRWFVNDREPLPSSAMPSGSGTSIVARTCWGASSNPGPIRTRLSELRRVHSQACVHRYEPISGCPSKRGFGLRPTRRTGGFREC